jgi:hypothetical protein
MALANLKRDFSSVRIRPETELVNPLNGTSVIVDSKEKKVGSNFFEGSLKSIPKVFNRSRKAI